MLKKEKLNCKKAIKRPLPYFPLWNISTAAPLARDLILLTLSKILCNLYVFLIEICLQWPFAFEIDFSDSLHFDWTYLHVFAIFIKDIWPTCLFVNKVRYVCNDHLQRPPSASHILFQKDWIMNLFIKSLNTHMFRCIYNGKTWF